MYKYIYIHYTYVKKYILCFISRFLQSNNRRNNRRNDNIFDTKVGYIDRQFLTSSLLNRTCNCLAAGSVINAYKSCGHCEDRANLTLKMSYMRKESLE